MLDMKAIIKNVRELKELEILSKELEAEIEAVKDTLKAEMMERNLEELTADVFKIRYQTIHTNRIDTKAIKAELPDIAKRYTKETVSRRFSVA